MTRTNSKFPDSLEFSQVGTLSGGFPGGSEVKASASNVGDLGLIPGLGRSPDPLEEGTATHSRILA